jgi:TolB protein
MSFVRPTIPSSALVGIVLLVSLAMLGSAAVAEGTFPGRDGRITFVRNSQLFVMKPNGSDVRRLTDGGSAIRGFRPSFSPGGRKIVFVSPPDEMGSQELAVINANGHHRRAVLSGGRYQEPAFAPSGERIAFAEDEDIRSVGLDGDGAQQLTADKGNDVQPTYSPRANRIAFVRRRHNPRYAQIWVMRRDGTHERAITGRGGYDDAEPCYSPDGRRVAFIRYGQVWVMRADGTRKERLTRFDLGPYQELSSPSFSPTGRRIAFVGPGPRNHAQVWVMSGTRTHMITNSRNGTSKWADWGPGR